MEKGRARVLVTNDVAPEGARKPVFGCVSYDAVELRDQLDLWEKYLLFPQGYRFIGIFYDVMYDMWEIIVESETIPLPPQGEVIPRYTPSYQVNYDPLTNARTASFVDFVKG